MGKYTGYATYNKDHIFLNTLLRERDNNFGMTIIRGLCEESLEMFKDINLEVETAGGAYLFYAQIGMTLKEPEQEVIEYTYDISLSSCLKDAKKLSSQAINTLKVILKEEKNIVVADNNDNILNEYREIFEELAKKKRSVLTKFFIPVVLDEMATIMSGEKRSSSSVGRAHLVMSEAGRNRWKEAIEGKKEFVPFKDLAHLQPFMRENQKRQLDELLLNLAKGDSKSSSLPTHLFMWQAETPSSTQVNRYTDWCSIS